MPSVNRFTGALLFLASFLALLQTNDAIQCYLCYSSAGVSNGCGGPFMSNSSSVQQNNCSSSQPTATACFTTKIYIGGQANYIRDCLTPDELPVNCTYTGAPNYTCTTACTGDFCNSDPGSSPGSSGTGATRGTGGTGGTGRTGAPSGSSGSGSTAAKTVSPLANILLLLSLTAVAAVKINNN